VRQFQFKLQTVLDVKKKREETLVEELAQLSVIYQQQKELLAFLEEKHSHYQTQLRTDEQDSLQINSILDHLEYLDYISQQITRQEDVLSKLSSDLEEKRASVVAASQECKLLEDLKERERRSYLKEYRREEQRFLDEVAQLSFSRKEAGILP
jgi:flagellar FliJ protein